ncbi:tetratricopeptide repeat protein 1 [Anopheles ziemanni]|uniref:tetratricopeptide repeat protein 1 n=1 Tax=Anopheles coustani TaxID=139045 RepID=UPI00265B6E33|nr:tetratricopeptide repeat protein 1 [Anopheles coustani]XP_058172599.1 tetratricopeptide repeat protein 1 [Anopheles ziemanni]
MSSKVPPDFSKSDEDQFEDAQTRTDYNERTVDEVIEKVTGLSMKRPIESDNEEFHDCANDGQAGTSATEDAAHPSEVQSTSSEPPDDSSVAPHEDDLIDEDSQRDYECGLSDEEKAANKSKADELKQQGNELFKQGEHRQSVDMYTKALRLCPLDCKEDRAILYANRAAAKAKVDRKLSAIEDCTKAIEYNPKYLKALMRRANLYEETDKLDESLEDFRKVSELDPVNGEARAAETRLPPKIAERNEHLKEEMMGKLKDLGNMILRPFGLSTGNFEMKQDPQTGSYSINFKQNANQ